MQLDVFAAILLSLVAAAFAQQTFNTTLTYDPIYDNGNLSTTGITCSNGGNGVICKNCALTLSQIPGYPNISGAPSFALPGGWNSVNCSSCWQLTLPTFNNTTINVRAVDATDDGFNVGFALMNAATGGRALEVGRVSAVARSIPDTGCEQGQQEPEQPKHAAQCPPPGFGCT